MLEIMCITMVILLLYSISKDKEQCNCEWCTSYESWRRTKEYAEKYPKCKYNIYNKD